MNTLKDLSDVELFNARALHFGSSNACEERHDYEWSVYANIYDELFLVPGGMEVTFQEGQEFQMIGPQLYDSREEPVPFEKWDCHQDPRWRRIAARVSPRWLTWDKAAAWIREHDGQPMLPANTDTCFTVMQAGAGEQAPAEKDSDALPQPSA